MTRAKTSRAHEHKPFLSTRKVFHVFAASLTPLYYWYHPLAATIPQARIQVVIGSLVGFILFLLFDLFRMRDREFNSKFMNTFSFIVRRGEEGRFTGATHLCFAFVVVSWFFSREVAVTAMLFLSLGDTSAEMAGRYFGKNKVFRRSLEGSLGFFLVTFPIAWVILDDWRVAVLGALAGTLVELFSFEVDDNLTVPIGSAAALFGALLLMHTYFP